VHPWQASQQEAAGSLCAHTATGRYVEAFLDTRFRDHYKRIFTEPGGWAKEAYVNYVAVGGNKGMYFEQLTEALVDSVHRFSTRPIIVVNFGSMAPKSLDPVRFPRLVLLHAHGVSGISFNFNKMIAILVAKVQTGVSVDSDMMVGPNADRLFNRTREEVTEEYPYPMLPTHYLDRDKDNADARFNNFLNFDCQGCPKPTMRWGQAHPTWTYWAFPFVSRWLVAKATGKAEHAVPTAGIGEDEDLLNVALWAENATKSWCMYQMMGASWVHENFLPQHPPGPAPFYEDASRYKDGVPIGFYMIHGEHEVSKVYKAMALLEDKLNHATELSPFFHKGKFYSDFSALKKDDPLLRCTM